jgi:hypothetical protein
MLSLIESPHLTTISWAPVHQQIIVTTRDERGTFEREDHHIGDEHMLLSRAGLSLAIIPASFVAQDPRALLEASVQGAHAVVVVGRLESPPIARPPSTSVLPPEIGSSSDTFDLLRVRAGEASVVVLHSGNLQGDAHPGGIYGPDHISQPLAESLLGPKSPFAMLTIEDDANDPIRTALSQRTYLGRRKPWRY